MSGLQRKILVSCLGCLFSLAASCQLDSGVYTGFERMKGYDPPRKWYHLNTVYIRHDSVFLYKEPVYIHRKDTVHSASDGAFYYYFGKFEQADTTIQVVLAKNRCDYCIRMARVDSTTGYMYPVIDTIRMGASRTPGGFVLGGVSYTRKEYNLHAFPQDFEKLFYTDDNDVYRINPPGQYRLIRQSIGLFLQSDSLKLTEDTIYICSDRVEPSLNTGRDTLLEVLDPASLDVHYPGKKIVYVSYADLKARQVFATHVCRFVQIGEIIDYKKAARIRLTYRLFPPPHAKGFSERQFETLLEFTKTGDGYQLEEAFGVGFELIEQ